MSMSEVWKEMKTKRFGDWRDMLVPRESGFVGQGRGSGKWKTGEDRG